MLPFAVLSSLYRIGVVIMSASGDHPHCCRSDRRGVRGTYGGRGPGHLPLAAKDGHLHSANVGQGEIPQGG